MRFKELKVFKALCILTEQEEQETLLHRTEKTSEGEDLMKS